MPTVQNEKKNPSIVQTQCGIYILCELVVYACTLHLTMYDFCDIPLYAYSWNTASLVRQRLVAVFERFQRFSSVH